jgi:hypothetical protein
MMILADFWLDVAPWIVVAWLATFLVAAIALVLGLAALSVKDRRRDRADQRYLRQIGVRL